MRDLDVPSSPVSYQMLGNQFVSKSYFQIISYNLKCTLVTLAMSLLWLQNPLEAKIRKTARCISALDRETPVAKISAKNIDFKPVAAWFENVKTEEEEEEE